jgi:NhaP-type Na+/H+ or K+/H+ antiporter
MTISTVLLVMLALVTYGLISRKLKGSILTGPLLFAIFGLLVGPWALGLISIEVSHEDLHTLAEITLVLVLFSDAASIDLAQLRRDHNLPVRMLLIGMPLTIILGTFAAVVMFSGFGFWEAALLAAILAPTDAALGQAVVSNPLVPVRIRQALNVESGLNDGIALPFVLAFAAYAGSLDGGGETGSWIVFAAKQIVFGSLAGVFLGYVGGKLMAWSNRSGWVSESAEGMIALGLAFDVGLLADDLCDT